MKISVIWYLLELGLGDLSAKTCFVKTFSLRCGKHECFHGSPHANVTLGFGDSNCQWIELGTHISVPLVLVSIHS